MEFRVLGPLEVSEGGRARAIGGPKQRTVLVHLILRSNHVVPPERLIEQIWGADPPPAARSTLRGYLSHLRRALAPGRLEHRSGGYVLHADPSSIDALRFEALVGEARARAREDPAAAARGFASAWKLWRGPALDDLADQPSLQPEIARLQELRLAATEERLGAELDLGRHRELIPELETLVASYPFRERLWAHLMTALYRSGRQADALAAFLRARDLLAEELGIDPSPELRILQERILRQDPSLDAGGEPLRGYRLLEQVGAGSFGAVHRAFQPQVGREVAIKTIHARFANDPEFIRRFEAEAQLLAGRHPFADSAPGEVMARHLTSPLPPVSRSHPGVPTAIDDVIARATAKDPTERYHDAVALASAFRAALAPVAQRPEAVGTEIRNPYKGLRPFLEPDAPDFFGRQTILAEILARLSDQTEGSRFLAV